MAELEDPESGQIIVLQARNLIGRGPSCFVRLNEARVSSEHAVLYWSDGVWEIRDLGSRNGSFVNGQRLQNGDRQTLRPGSRLAFGAPTPIWRLADASPPQKAEDREESTLFAEDGFSMERLNMRFTASADEEHVQIHLHQGGCEKSIPPRAFHYLLLTLARARKQDKDAHVVADTEQGWIYADELAAKLGMDVERMNVDIFRARKQLTDLGVAGANALVERRTTTHQLRLGTGQIDIV